MADGVISVRGLVEFLLRSGDLDNTHGKSSEEAMLAGSRLHRKLQEAAEGNYQPEVPLSVVWNYDSLSIEIEGRADGIYYGTNPGETEAVWTVDEIKTTYRRLQQIRRPEPVHLAQAKCYAYIYALQNHLEKICVRMTYCSLLTEHIRRFYEVDTMEELTSWFTDLMEQYRPWAEYSFTWIKTRTDSIHSLRFPFTWRPGQKELAASVYRTIVHGRKLFLEAPTGTGKTISTLFPAIKAVGEHKASRIFYLTARTTTRQAAEDTIELMRAEGLKFKSVVLTAREKICILDKPDCNPDSCPRAAGHYDRVNEALYHLLTSEDDFSRDNIEKTAEQYQVCPFELSLDISLFADAVIGDYNYLFDPHAYLRRFFGDRGNSPGSAIRNHIRNDGKVEDYAAVDDTGEEDWEVDDEDVSAGGRDNIFLIDEAHNLVDRGREMYSAALVREDVLVFRRKIKEIWPDLARKLSRCSRVMLSMRNREMSGPGDGKAPFTVNGTKTADGGTQWYTAGTRNENRRNYQVLGEIDELASAVNAVDMEISDILGEERIADQTGLSKKDPLRKKKKEVRNDLLDFYFNIDHFAQMYAGMDDHYVTYQEVLRNGHFRVKLFCVDPSGNLAQCMKRGRSTILFSATLLPITYYKALLGGSSEDYEVYAESMFDPERRGLFLVQDLTTRYRDRTPETYAGIADCIRNTISERHGNYLVFFPSYQFMEEVAARFRRFSGVQGGAGGSFPEDRRIDNDGGRSPELSSDGRTGGAEGLSPELPSVSGRTPSAGGQEDEITLLCQHSGMTEEEREAFLARFNTVRDDHSLVGFCVMGGIFSEGIDLKNDTLIGVIVVGTGVPQVCSEREILKDYFDGRGVNGYDYAYRFPGMNKVQQAAGRVIRTQDDVGLIVLLDGRFATPSYRRLFPREWQNAVVTNRHEVGHEAEKFWNEWL